MLDLVQVVCQLHPFDLTLCKFDQVVQDTLLIDIEIVHCCCGDV